MRIYRVFGHPRVSGVRCGPRAPWNRRAKPPNRPEKAPTPPYDYSKPPPPAFWEGSDVKHREVRVHACYSFKVLAKGQILFYNSTKINLSEKQIRHPPYACQKQKEKGSEGI